MTIDTPLDRRKEEKAHEIEKHLIGYAAHLDTGNVSSHSAGRT